MFPILEHNADPFLRWGDKSGYHPILWGDELWISARIDPPESIQNVFGSYFPKNIKIVDVLDMVNFQIHHFSAHFVIFFAKMAPQAKPLC